ncbi:MAG: signal recognition particle-docking protein FtsY [Synechococcaceae cyanobacterium]|nr:signal recognition particle-docking protein FtsY [Synechococcaceae cyanobacterium]
MVFDWFRRRLAPQPAPAKAEEEASPPAAAPEAPAPAPESAPGEPTPPPAEPAPEEPAESPGGGPDQDALAWARQAYARLKAEQQTAAAAAAAPPPAPAAPPAVPAPCPESAPAPSAPPAEVPLAEVPPAEVPAGPSLLEQAAAQRQQRLKEIAEAAPAAPPVAPAPPAAPVAPSPAAPEAEPGAEEAEPRLGAFDDTFTWSAEVLAAQGRRPDQVSLEEIDWLGRLRRGLEKTRRGFVTQLLENLGDDPLTPEVLDDLESTLLRADVGVQATDEVLDALRRRLNEEVVEPAEGIRFLKEQLRSLLEAPIAASGRDLLAPGRDRLNVWLLVGVNGVGKTTTLGKLANLAVRSGYSCLIAAADTFRAAAVQQVAIWGERSGVPVIANPSANADPAAVVYDAIGAARSKGTELVLVDTAGRLQTKHNLMEELTKVRRIIDRQAPEAAVESLLVLDASQGQNGLRQAMAFAGAAGLTGVVITKLDGSARGGVAIAVAHEAGLPIRFVGAGEGIRDLRPFNSFEFVEALLSA